MEPKQPTPFNTKIKEDLMTASSGKGTDGQRFLRVVNGDTRVRSQAKAAKISQQEFKQKYAQLEQKQAEAQQKSRNRKTALLLAEALGESVSFTERARFIMDHGSKETQEALLNDQVTFQEAWRLSQADRELKRLQKPSGKPTTVGGLMAKIAADNNSFLSGGTRWTEEQRDLVASLVVELARDGHVTDTELEATLSSCFRRNHFTKNNNQGESV
jgi:hypothetical protein